MAKWYGNIGYAATFMESRPGIWNEQYEVRPYYGESYKNARMLQSSGVINDGVNASIQISIIADPYAMQNFHTMRYVEYMGSKWKITNVEVQYPRLILTIGGLYNDES